MTAALRAAGERQVERSSTGSDVCRGDTPALKPCPFCGGSDLTLRFEMMPTPQESRPWYWAVWCSCGARCQAIVVLWKDGARERAIEAWNNRHEGGL